MDAVSDRRLLIHLLRTAAGELPDIQEHDQTRLHAVRIVMACFDSPGGLRALRSALQLMAPGTPGTQNLCGLLESATLDALLPERVVKHGRDLVRRLPASLERLPQSDLATFVTLPGVHEPVQVFDALLSRHEGLDGPHLALSYVDRLAGLAGTGNRDELRRWVHDQAVWLGAAQPVRAAADVRESADPAGKTAPGSSDPASTSEGAVGAFREPDAAAGPNVASCPNSAKATEPVQASDPVAVALPDQSAPEDTGDLMSPIAPPTIPAKSLPQVWGDVPPRNPRFTGRDELLKRLHAQLSDARETAVLPQAVHGMGGVGKSQLAIEYVHRHSQEYDLVWWISAEQQGQILTALTNLAQRLALETGAEANVAVPAVREALSTGRSGHRNWLLVFDNAENLEEVRQFFPTGGAGKILVTSRNQSWERVAETLEVDVFTREESSSFLRSLAPGLSSTDADRLAEALGDLPLAVEQAAAWRSSTGMPVDEYLSLLAEKQIDKRMLLLQSMPSPDYGLSVAAAWDMSFDRLEETNPAAMQLLQTCSYFAPEPISRDLFAGSPAAPITPELDEMLDDPITLSRAIRDIQRYALAKFDHRGGTLQMHRLVQQVLMGRMTDEQRTVMRHGAHIMLANGNPGNPHSPDQWKRYQALRPHLVVSGGLACTDGRVRQLVFNMVKFLYNWGDHEGCEVTAREVYKHWCESLGEEHLQTLQFASYLAWIMWVNGAYADAEALGERTLSLYRAVAGDEDEGTLYSMNAVAKSRRASGAFRESLALDEAAFETARRVLGADDPSTLAIAHNLAVSLRLHGEFVRSRMLDEETYRQRCEVIGPRNTESLRTKICLGIDQREAGDYLGARTLLEDTYRECLEEFGVDAPITLFAARNLAVGRRRAGDHGAARALSEETLKRLGRRYRDDYPETMSMALNLSVDLRHSGELDAAIALGTATSDRFSQKYGPAHPHPVAARINLAVALRLSGDVDGAYKIDKKAIEDLRSNLGPDDVVTLTCAINLASDLYARGDIQAAYEMDIDTLDRSRRMLGEAHPSTLACAANLALDLRALDRIQESDKIQSDTMIAFCRVLGDKHPATLNALQSLRADCDVDPIPL
jgi:tetratricopeptide (TPR) repeat protein